MFQVLPDWALLRNADVFGNFRRGGDCDILIKDLDAGEKAMRQFLGTPTRIARRSYVLSYYYPWGHIDLTNHYYWRGIRLCTGESILAASSRRGEWPVVSEIHEAIFLLLSSFLWGGFIKTRYTKTISKLFDSQTEKVSALLRSMLGLHSAHEIHTHAANSDWFELEQSVRSLRHSILFHHFTKHPLRSSLGQLHFYYKEILLRIYPNLPVMVLAVDRKFNKSQIKVLISEACEKFEYKCIIEGEASGHLKHFSIFQNLRLRSFRARNGLIVSLVDQGSFTHKSKTHFRINLEEDTPLGVTQAFIMFQKMASLRFK